MRSLKTVLTVIGAVTVLVLAGNTVALATSGHALIVGKANKSKKMTTLKRTRPGPAFKVTTKSPVDPPFAVNGQGQVTNLNADLVDGLHAGAFLQRSEIATIVYDAAPSGAPMSKIGTVLGDTFYGRCTSPSAGETTTDVFLQTDAGNWAVDYIASTTDSTTTSEAHARHFDLPAGTFTSPGHIDAVTADATTHTADKHLEIVQLAPQRGHVSWHVTSIPSADGTQHCHISVQAVPSS